MIQCNQHTIFADDVATKMSGKNKKTNHSNNKRASHNGATPAEMDILMGRGNTHKNHPGNIIFQGKYLGILIAFDSIVQQEFLT
jgi:hypothetical protein